MPVILWSDSKLMKVVPHFTIFELYVVNDVYVLKTKQPNKCNAVLFYQLSTSSIVKKKFTILKPIVSIVFRRGPTNKYRKTQMMTMNDTNFASNINENDAIHCLFANRHECDKFLLSYFSSKYFPLTRRSDILHFIWRYRVHGDDMMNMCADQILNLRNFWLQYG